MIRWILVGLMMAGVSGASEPGPYTPPEPESDVDPYHMSIGGGMSESIAVAVGRSLDIVRFDLGFGWKEDDSTRDRRCGCRVFRTQDDVDVWDVTVGAYPTIPIGYGVSLYAGGGIGLLIADFGSQVDTTGVGKASVGAEMLIDTGLSLDFGYQGLWAFDRVEADGYELDDYDSHGVYAGLRYRF